MAYSMTGYSRLQFDDEEVSLGVTIRSVNHRFLDLQIRTPPQIEPFENLIRRTVKQRVKRGQLQINISLQWKQAPEQLVINRLLVDAYLGAYHEISERYGIMAQPDLSEILRVPGMVTFDSGELDEERRATLENALERCLDGALEELNRTRSLEAEGIVEEMRQRGESMKRDIKALRKSMDNLVPQFQQRLREKIEAVAENFKPDPQRILQEAAILADRADISEEVQRLESHTGRLLSLLKKESELGKKIDFLAQELNRETNTVLSKTNPLGAAALPVTEVGLRLKAEIEKIREQAQNLE